eukprot:scaffold616_cov257-Pinguiococcus_pyrenoidosus.AAC.12
MAPRSAAAARRLLISHCRCQPRGSRKAKRDPLKDQLLLIPLCLSSAMPVTSLLCRRLESSALACTAMYFTKATPRFLAAVLARYLRCTLRSRLAMRRAQAALPALRLQIRLLSLAPLHALVHAHGDGADEEAEQHEAAGEGEGHEVEAGHQRPLLRRAIDVEPAKVAHGEIVAAEDVHIHHVRPVFHRGQAKEGHHGPLQGPEVPRVIPPEQLDTRDGVEVEHQQHQQEDVADGAEAGHEALDDHLQLADLPHQLQQSGQAQQP